LRRHGSTLLRIGALVLAAYGVVFFVKPSVLAGLVGLEFTSPNAPVEVRSFYGGLELGMAAFLFACARSPRLLPAGLLFSALAFSCAGAARLLGVLEYGFLGPSQPLVGVLEIAVGALSAWLRAAQAE
jgi:hypothetical protein